MSSEVTRIDEVKTSSDGTVKISVEKYYELLRLANKPQTINRVQVIKTSEVLSREFRIYGGTLMGLGASLFTVGVLVYRAGR